MIHTPHTDGHPEHTTETCLRCGRPTADGYACTPCATRGTGQLDTVVQLAPVARDVAHRLARRSGGSSANKPGSQPPLDFGVIERLDEVQNTLVGWVRHVIEERGAKPMLVQRGDDPIVLAAQWLGTHLEWMRHRREVDEALEDIHQAARKIAAIANGREPGRYAGPCGYVDDDGELCGEDVESRPGAKWAKCRTCGSEYDVEERQAWMRGEIEGHLARPVEIAGVLLQLGFPIGYSTIAAYAAKGQLVAHGVDGQGRPLYRIGDVIDLRVGAKKGQRAHG